MRGRAIQGVPGGTWDRAPGPGAELARGPGQGPGPRGPEEWGGPGAHPEARYKGTCTAKGPRWNVGPGPGPRGQAGPEDAVRGPGPAGPRGPGPRTVGPEARARSPYSEGLAKKTLRENARLSNTP